MPKVKKNNIFISIHDILVQFDHTISKYMKVLKGYK